MKGCTTRAHLCHERLQYSTHSDLHEYHDQVHGICFSSDVDADVFESNMKAAWLSPMETQSGPPSRVSSHVGWDEKLGFSVRYCFETFLTLNCISFAARLFLHHVVGLCGTHPSHCDDHPLSSMPPQTHNVPEEWKVLFRTAGIRRRDMDNRETARYVLSLSTYSLLRDTRYSSRVAIIILIFIHLVSG